MPDPRFELRLALERDVLAAAPHLLGWRLRRGDRAAVIVEVEAYRGSDDAGCHAFYGRTPRTEIMFGRAGLAYVYFTYGCHWMLNVTAHREGDAAAVLIRAAEPIAGHREMATARPLARRDEDLLSGPGKLAAAFGVGRDDYGADLLDPVAELRLEPGAPPGEVHSGPRIGLAPGKGEQLPWRFADGSKLRWVSKPHATLRPRGVPGPASSGE